MRQSNNYQFTLPVVNGKIQDVDGELVQLRLNCQTDNFFDRESLSPSGFRWVVDLKFRGPRFRRPYTSPRDTAYAVDVYVRRRRECV